MILTRDFVILNHPKTGSTFTREVVKKSETKIGNNFRRYRSESFEWYILSFLSSLDIYRLPYLELHHQNRWSILNHFDQHGGASQVPDGYRYFPHAVVVRNPLELYVSNYEYGWWKDNPQVPEGKLYNKLPSFPDLSFDEYLLYQNLRLDSKMQRFNISNDSIIGFHTLDYIRTLFYNPEYVIRNISEDFIESEEYRKFLPNVTIIRNRNLNNGLYKFITSKRYSKNKVNFILEEEKIFPKRGGRDKNDWSSYYSEDTKERVFEKENLTFLLLNRLGVNYRQ